MDGYRVMGMSTIKQKSGSGSWRSLPGSVLKTAGSELPRQSAMKRYSWQDQTNQYYEQEGKIY